MSLLAQAHSHFKTREAPKREIETRRYPLAPQRSTWLAADRKRQ
jgi:hypothetical protein